MRLRKCLIMVLAILSIVCFMAFASGCNKTIYFEQDEYTVRNGDKITAVGNAEYTILGDAVEGVSVAKDGTFTILSSATNGAQVLLAAVKDGVVKDTAICNIVVSLESPTLTFTNLTNYLIDGEQATAESTPSYSISYSLKQATRGVTVDEVTGRVSYTDKVVDGQEFTVVASSYGVSIEKKFYAAITDLSSVENSVAFVELGTNKSVSYKVNFPNAEIEQQGVLGVIAGRTRASESEFSYDSATHTVTINSGFLDKMGQGETSISIATGKNTAFATVKKATFIGSAEELASIKDTKESVAGYYVLVCDIDLTDYLREKPTGWDPIGTYKDVLDGTALDMAFSGTFDGNGHTISGFYVNKSNVEESSSFNTGLFGYVTRTGKVKNLNLVGAKDAGYNVCSYAGAMVGVNEGTIQNCMTNVLVNSDGGSCIGGFVGKNLGNIKNCYSLGKVVGDKEVGAFCGKNDDGEIANCYAVGENPFCGSGLAVDSAVYQTEEQMLSQANFNGWDGWTINSDKLPKINGVEIELYLRSIKIVNARTEYVKGYSLELSVSVNPAGLTGYNLSYDVLSGNGITIDANGKVDLSNAVNGSYVVKVSVGNISAQFAFTVGDTAKNLIVIRTVEDFNSFKNDKSNFNKDVVLMSDLDFENAQTTSVGYYYENEDGTEVDLSAVFTGTFNGNGHTIKNLKIVANDYSATSPENKYHASFYNVGLFSYVKGTIKNLTLQNVTVTPTYGGEPTGSFIGVVCGTLKGSIQNCELIDCSYYGMDDSSIKSGWFTATETPNLSGCTVNGQPQ